jgi:predicted RNA binding protein YcfA (HicA-like mRNA interferase family)
MPKITPISYKKFDKFLRFVGCELVSQKGSHRKYSRSGLIRPIIVPIHKTVDIPIFVIKNTLRILGLANEQYLNILEQL